VRVSTIVFLHAHPDDEASQTSGSMARAVAEGHRVVTVFATNGDHGELPAEGLREGETLVHWRRREAQASAKVLGVQRIAWLGYADSGMTGWEQNTADGAFLRADLDEAAQRLVAVLDEEAADVLVGYDGHGGYGHPDHVRVNRLVHHAAARAAHRPRLLESTFNRDQMRYFYEAAVASGQGDAAFDPDQPQDDGNPMGTPEAQIDWQVDVRAYLPQRRASLEAHRSQASDIEMLLGIPSEPFAAMFGVEHYIEPGLHRPGAPEGGMRIGWPFEAVLDGSAHTSQQ
jgi:LmbE family N-acetylglucosaminyl deacetylase